MAVITFSTMLQKSSTSMFKNDPAEGVDINVMGFMNIME